ncbi:hypothetical protein N431DRAFT_362763 [Stipitochalara longipes BDJ]|nr:hypothetical protein N431DRAFT_362763 [Stipitochalara longipes BDJ]
MQNASRSWLPLCWRKAAGSRWRLAQARRSFSSESREGEILKVACGSSGSIDADLYNASVLQNPSSPLIIYLPPTGVHLQTSHPAIPRYLFHSSVALASINYRWNIPSSSSPTANPTPPSSPSPTLLSNHPSFKTHAFPTPLHDILHAYTQLLSLVSSPSPPQTSPSSRSPFSPRPRTFYAPNSPTKTVQRPILIYGSYLGAGLATSLALTESFASKQLPTRIAGLVVSNGVYDWSEVATTTSSPPFSLNQPDPFDADSGDGDWDSKTLYRLREKLFSNPGGAFDPFASPILFFRTAGLGVPKTWPVPESSSPPDSSSTSPSPPSQSSSPLIAHDEESTFYPTPDPSLVTDMDIEELEMERRGGRDGGSLELEVSRRANLKFPPKDSGLKIPRLLFLYSEPHSEDRSAPVSTSAGRSAASKQARKQARRKPNAGLDVFEEHVEGEGEVTARGQAEEMVRLIRRSIVLHEFKERVQWDEDLDPESAAKERVGISALSGVGKEDTVVREWIKDVLDA